MKAIAKVGDQVIAESENTIQIEGNHYFPPEDVKKEALHETSTSSHCPWKGDASYYTVEADGKKLEDAAWYYPQPKSAAEKIKNYVAFWKGVAVEEVQS